MFLPAHIFKEPSLILGICSPNIFQKSVEYDNYYIFQVQVQEKDIIICFQSQQCNCFKPFPHNIYIHIYIYTYIHIHIYLSVCILCVLLFTALWTVACQALLSVGIFPTQGLNLCLQHLLHCRILYPLSLNAGDEGHKKLDMTKQVTHIHIYKYTPVHILVFILK